MPVSIAIVMMAVAAIILTVTKASVAGVPRCKTCQSGVTAIIGILHPNDPVNCSQSTNDVYPTAVKLGIVLTLRDAVSALRELQTGLKAKAAEFADVLKMGRTENQDAVPMTLGQELGAYGVAPTA